jgi:hypothetical protein
VIYLISIEKTETFGWEAAIRGMRNPMNSWDKSDSLFCKRTDCYNCLMRYDCGKESLDFDIGANDHKLMKILCREGSVHAKYRRMIAVYADITAPLYWWKEFDTYKVGTVANSCSTMHKIADKEFTLDDFSHEYLLTEKETEWGDICPVITLECTISALNNFRKTYIETRDKIYWWQMIQLLPSSYNQKRTVMMNYEVLSNIYHSRKDHKLDEWRELCEWIKKLPYSEMITG